MSNLKIGDTVFYAGKKRTVESLKKVCGFSLVKMVGHAYMVRSDLVKPVVRVTEIMRALLIVEMVQLKLKGFSGENPWSSVWTHNFKVRITRKDYDDARKALILKWRPYKEAGVLDSAEPVRLRVRG